VKAKANFPTDRSIDQAKLNAALGKSEITDSQRIDALITLFGGHYAFPVFFEVRQLFENGRAGLDAFLNENPTLLRK